MFGLHNSQFMNLSVHHRRILKSYISMHFHTYLTSLLKYKNVNKTKLLKITQTAKKNSKSFYCFKNSLEKDYMYSPIYNAL